MSPPRGQSHRFTESRKINSLVSLKGLFICLIVLHNTIASVVKLNTFPGSSFIINFGGQLGDSMFFMISGFLFGYAYLNRIQSKEVSFSDYLIRRLKKLYPLYILSNFAAMMLFLIQYGISSLPISKTVLTAFLQLGGGLEGNVPYNSPTWFISALFMCYIVFYFIAYYSKNKTHYYCMIVIGIVWGYYLSNHNLSIPFCYSGNGAAFLNFFIGVLLFEILPCITHNVHKVLYPSCIFGLILCFTLLFRFGINIMAGNFATVCSFAICPIVLYLSVSHGWISRLLNFNLFIQLGRLSFSIFFWHMVCFDFLRVFIFKPEITVSNYIIYLIVLLICSLLSNHFTESNKQYARQ